MSIEEQFEGSEVWIETCATVLEVQTVVERFDQSTGVTPHDIEYIAGLIVLEGVERVVVRPLNDPHKAWRVEWTASHTPHSDSTIHWIAGETS